MIYVIDEDKDNENIINYDEYNIIVKYSNLDLTGYYKAHENNREDIYHSYEYIGFDGDNKYSQAYRSKIYNTDYIIM